MPTFSHMYCPINSVVSESVLQCAPLVLAGVVQWIERRPAKQRVTGSIPSQGTCLGCRPGPHLGARERQPHMDVSLPFFL